MSTAYRLTIRLSTGQEIHHRYPASEEHPGRDITDAIRNGDWFSLYDDITERIWTVNPSYVVGYTTFAVPEWAQ